MVKESLLPIGQLPKQDFSRPTGTYTILKLRLEDYDRVAPLPAGFEFHRSPLSEELRQQERNLLKENFPQWERAFLRRMEGCRDDSPIFVTYDGSLAAGLYACSENEHSLPGWGQLHYFFVRQDLRGRGLHSALFAEAVKRLKSWGLDGVIINTDREALPELYQRWGAKLWKSVPKSKPEMRHAGMGAHNWLVYAIHDEALWQAMRLYAAGVLVDIGCGKKPYRPFTDALTTAHIGVDHPDTQHGLVSVDVVGTAYDTTLAAKSCDTVLCTVVLEHLERPAAALEEIFRILTPEGHLILSAPLFWPLHEEPRDFFRYTKFGLEHLLREAGFEIVEIKPLSGFFVTTSLLTSYFIEQCAGGWWGKPLRLIQKIILKLAYYLWTKGRDSARHFTWCYLAVARKPAGKAVTLERN